MVNILQEIETTAEKAAIELDSKGETEHITPTGYTVVFDGQFSEFSAEEHAFAARARFFWKTDRTLRGGESMAPGAHPSL
jgi:hypothetical protein